MSRRYPDEPTRVGDTLTAVALCAVGVLVAVRIWLDSAINRGTRLPQTSRRGGAR